MVREGLFDGSDRDLSGNSIAPPVIDEKFVADDTEPTLVFLPSERYREGDEHATIEFRRTTDGRLAVLAYTSLEALVGSCGQQQPWVQLSSAKIDGIVADSGADMVLWDAELPPEQRRDEA